MKLSVKLIVLFPAIAMLAGCATGPDSTVNGKNLLCAVAGGLVGGGATAAVSDGGGEATAAGAAAGAILALLLCQDDAVAEEPQPPVCAVAPPPGALLDADGCPFDDDGDGVYAGLDLCPGTPLGVTVDKDGCPPPPRKVLSLTGVNFEFDKASLTAGAKEILEEAVIVLEDIDNIIEVQVIAHTDSIGTEAYNLKLSQRRAESVVDYLVSRGIDGNKLVPVGMGETDPIANNDTAAGRAANRRVDFVVRQ